MSTLFRPVQVGAFALDHRVVLAPLTRMRSEMPGNVPGEAMVEYYAQRATPGGLLIAEATFIARQGNGGYASPGIEDEAQVAGWAKVVDAVHARGATILLQLWHAGRASHASLQPDGDQPIAPSALDAGLYALLEGGPGPATPPRELGLAEIPAVVEQYRAAAERAQQAGFDGVEIHAANGYLIDQFLQDGSNRRTDAYGGPIENRARLLIEVVDAVTAIWGADRVGVRLGPSNSFNAMSDSDPAALFSHVTMSLRDRAVAYLHVIEPRVEGNAELGHLQPVAAGALKRVFAGPIIAAGGFDGAGAEAIVSHGDADLVAFGRHFIANPDLPRRVKERLPLNAYDRSTFYYGGERGYADYPFADAVPALG
ncbi:MULTISPECIES: alkene reductase [unclassified Methylobacterium]|uniref:alkene reductase n=1 Tax=unclassified Methylobacterium TaxID=2615210 RepID=UPI00226A8595|nr:MULTISPECIES: alkene reductase [unclassified Methylobacterium]